MTNWQRGDEEADSGFGFAVAEEKPWLAREEWRDGIIRNDEKLLCHVLIWISVLVNLFMWFLFGAIINKEGWGVDMVLAAGLLPLIGIIIAAATVYVIMRQRKYGVAEFRMQPMPGVVGGILGGVVTVNQKVIPLDGFTASLVCTRTHGSGKNSTFSNVWDEKQTIKVDLLADDPNRTGIPILFAIPFDQPETILVRKDNITVEWTLTVSAETLGIDFAASFKVPIYKTEDSREDFSLDDVDLPRIKEPLGQKQYREAGVSLTESDYALCGQSLFEVRVRALLFTIFLITIMIGGGLWCLVAGKVAPGIIILIFFGLPFFFSGLELVRASHQFRATEDGVFQQGGFVFQGAEQYIPRDRIESISVAKPTVSGGTGFHHIQLKDTDGKEHCLLSYIAERTIAADVVIKLERMYALDPPHAADDGGTASVSDI